MNGDFWRNIGQGIVEDVVDGPDGEVIYLAPEPEPTFWQTLSNGEKIAAVGVGLALVALIVRR